MAATQRTTGNTRLKGPVVVTLRGAGSKGHDAQTVGAGADVGFSVQVPTAQTANAFQIEQPDGTVVFALGPKGGMSLGSLSSFQSFRVQKTLSTAILEAINTTPFPMVATPGTGYALAYDRLKIEVVFATVAFVTSYSLIPVYHGATAALSAGTLTTTQGQSGATILCDIGGPVAAGITLTQNVGIDLYSATNWANTSTPDTTLIATLDYTVIKLT